MRNIPPVTKNILLINIAVWLLDMTLQRYNVNISHFMGLMNPTSIGFHIWQPLTYMFLHANLSHLFFNMFAVWMFGSALEQHLGSTKYLIYYLFTGLGAAATQIAVWALFNNGQLACTIGASGAVFGILLAFGWLFPEVQLFFLFIPIPIRARIMVVLYAVVELSVGIADVAGRSIDNIAHFAHLGGMVFGILLLLIWKYGDRFHFPKWKRKPKQTGRFREYHYQEPIR